VRAICKLAGAPAPYQIKYFWSSWGVELQFKWGGKQRGWSIRVGQNFISLQPHAGACVAFGNLNPYAPRDGGNGNGNGLNRFTPEYRGGGGVVLPG
jgi:hypothetical protein